MGLGLDLPCAEIVIECEFLYDPNLFAKNLKRVRRQGVDHVVDFQGKILRLERL